jgi:hypothetical protein
MAFKSFKLLQRLLADPTYQYAGDSTRYSYRTYERPRKHTIPYLTHKLGQQAPKLN